MALLNKLFVQMALAPALKIGAYLAVQSLMLCLITAPTERSAIPKQRQLSHAANFFSALAVARETVFSRRICRPLAFFSRPAMNNQIFPLVELDFATLER
jgi:hypothetical protein